MKHWIIVIISVCLVGFALPRVSIDVDVFNLLPEKDPSAQGLKKYQKHFAASRDLIISLRATAHEELESLVADLASLLEELELAQRVVWKNSLTAGQNQIAQFIAYQWMNQPDDKFDAMARKFTPRNSESVLSESIERIASSFRPDEIGRLTRDPFGLTEVGGNFNSDQLTHRDPFTGKNGEFRIIIVTAPEQYHGFSSYRLWLNKIRHTIERWKNDNQIDSVIRLSGNPAFVVETGTGLARDISLAALGTLIFVSILFYAMHRQLRPLIWLVGLLMLSGMGALVLTHWFFSPIYAVSLAFAVILIGLATDYGLIIYQEKVISTDQQLSHQRRQVAPSICWAAATTGAAFLVLSFSSLPGVTQLGILVAVGVVIAAFLMLFVFLPASGNVTSKKAAYVLYIEKITLSPRAFLALSIWFLVFAMLVLIVKKPLVDTDSKGLGPISSEARDAREEIRKYIDEQGVKLWLLVAAEDDSSLKTKLARLESELDKGVEHGLFESYFSPQSIWPNPQFQGKNLAKLQSLVDQWGYVKQVSSNSGFTDEALILTKGVFDTWAEFSKQNRVSPPDDDFYRWSLDRLRAKDTDKLYALISIQAADGVEVSQLSEYSQRIGALGLGQLIGWNLLADALTEVMQRDITRVLIPMALVLVVMLWFTFRTVGEVFLSLCMLLFSIVVLSSLMIIFKWSWNLMNVMALSLLLGAGVDYSIHIQLALKRFSGDLHKVRSQIGPAILLCGASTGVAFASLSFANNAGLASLGRVTALGIVIASLTAVFLLPVWWHYLNGTHDE